MLSKFKLSLKFCYGLFLFKSFSSLCYFWIFSIARSSNSLIIFSKHITEVWSIQIGHQETPICDSDTWLWGGLWICMYLSLPSHIMGIISPPSEVFFTEVFFFFGGLINVCKPLWALWDSWMKGSLPGLRHYYYCHK